MGNSQSEVQSRKKRSPGGFKTQFTRHSTYRSYLGHDEISACALAASRERLCEDPSHVTSERAIDVPLELPVNTSDDTYFATSFTNVTYDTTNSMVNTTDNTTANTTATMHRSETTLESNSSNMSDYCIITRKDAGLEDIAEELSLEESDSIKKPQRKVSQRLKKIFSIRRKTSNSTDGKEKESPALGESTLKCPPAGKSDEALAQGKQRRSGGCSLPHPKTHGEASLLEDSFWWDNQGTSLDENNNNQKQFDNLDNFEFDDSFEETGPCPAVLQILNWTTWKDNSATALVDGQTGKRYSFKELEEVTRRVAIGLSRVGVEPGSSVYVVSHNCLEVIITFLATLSLGGITIMADPNVTHGKMTSHLTTLEPVAVITDTEHVDAAARTALFKPKLTVYVIGGRNWSKKCHSFKRLLEENIEDTEMEPFISGASDVVLHVTCWDVFRNTKRYSTRLTNRNIVSSIEHLRSLEIMRWKAARMSPSTTSAHGCCDRCGGDVDRTGVAQRPRTQAPSTCTDVILGVVPFCHPFGLISVALWSLIQQATLVTLPHWEMRAVQNVCSMHHVTVLPVLSNWTSVMTTHPVVKKAGRLPPEVIIVSNAVFPNWRPVEKLWRIGVRKVTFVYTLAECTGVISALSITPHQTSERKGGIIPAGSMIKIVDVNGKQMDPEVKGEIYIRGPQVMESTHNQAAAKIGFLEKGWLKTGDSGTIKDGHLMMLGHVNDVISYQGVTVCLRAIEDLICRHPAVSEACVVARWALGAHVIRRPGFNDVSEKDILDYVNDFTPHHCRLVYVEFSDQLPLTASGRIVRLLVRPKDRTSQRHRHNPDPKFGFKSDHQVLI